MIKWNEKQAARRFLQHVRQQEDNQAVIDGYLMALCALYMYIINLKYCRLSQYYWLMGKNL